MNEKQTAFFKDCDSFLKVYEENKPLTYNPEDLNSINQIGCNYKTLFIMAYGEDIQPRICEWMHLHEFKQSPASAKFHGNFQYGLMLHTYLVTYLSLKLAKGVFENFFESPLSNDFDISAKDIVTAAVFHDFCKAGNYESYTQNHKIPGTQREYIEVTKYKNKSGLRNLGHGNESMLILLELIPDYIHNRPVLEAISRHMGFSDLSEYEKYNYSEFLKNPLVLLLQLADQAASAWYNL